MKPPTNGEIALQTPRSDLLPCHFYFYGTKCKAKDITSTYESVYHIKMVNGFKQVLERVLLLVSEVKMVRNDLTSRFTTRWADLSRKECDQCILGRVYIHSIF